MTEYLKKAKWDLDLALDKYYSEGNDKKIKAQDNTKVLEVFKKYFGICNVKKLSIK